MSKRERERSSFRDNRGFVYYEDGAIFRQVNASAAPAFTKLMDGGLYRVLTQKGLLVPHETVEQPEQAGVYAVIRPTRVPVITYPYEWAFSQLKDAALATLTIQKLALQHGMTLRDASAYNIQWLDGKPCLIDTLSFDVHETGAPWTPYRQFCQHFLAPLALMAHVDLGLSQLLRVHIDGIPLPLAAKLLPLKKRLNFGLVTHLTMHATFQRRHEDTGQKAAVKLSETALLGLIDSLERTVRGLELPKTKTQWGDYYDHTNYDETALAQKGQMVGDYLAKLRPARVLDLGSNDGTFSRVALGQGADVISSDIDPLAVESNYVKMRRGQETRLVPMLIDLTNPSPGLGWANGERASFSERAKSDVALALALIHHLAIANNLPLGHVAQYFAQLSAHLIIEFVPKEDSQVRRLLATREDIFADYTHEGFEAAFSQVYDLIHKQPVPGTARSLYLMRRKSSQADAA